MSERTNPGVASSHGPILDALDAPVVIVDRNGGAVFVNAEWRRVFGEPPATPWAFLSVVSPSDRDRVQRTLATAIQTCRNAGLEFTAYHKSGDAAILDCAFSRFTDRASNACYIVGLCRDVTDERRHEERLAFMAGHDPLTGLSNRRAFEEALGRAVSRAHRGSRVALLLMDMDHLKEYNDRRGHLEGDQAIINLSLLLRRHVRSADLPARIGGDEFAVLLEDAGAEDAYEIAERIRAAASSEEFVPGARELSLGVSGGIAEASPDVDARALVDRADAALYAAKNGGRNTIVVWNADVHAPSAERLASRVRAAFTDGSFCLLYQPVVRLSDGAVTYFESLVRMHDADGSLASPDAFLPIVEQLGLMPRLTTLLVRLALGQLAAEPRATISLNLSHSDIGDEQLLDEVAALVGDAPQTRGRLLFEVSESTLLSNLAGGRAWMTRLADLGCRFVLDNFGTGAGMFALLREPRIEQVKLAHAVMRSMAAEEGNRAFVASLRELIESQGKLAVAGYLETDELLHDVREAGFEWGQGFRLHRPSADLSALIEQVLPPLGVDR